MKTPSGVGFFSSLKFKFALSYMVMIIAVIALMNTYFLGVSRDMIFSTKLASIKSQSATLETALRDIEQLTIDAVSQVISRLELGGLSQIMVLGPHGNVLYDMSDLTDTLVDEHLDDVLSGYDVYHVSFYGDAFTACAFIPVVRAGAITGAIYLSELDTEQGNILLGLQNSLKNISIVILVLSIILVAFMLWTITRRITSILQGIESVREGEYNYQINLSGNDELTALGREFDDLTGRLRETDDVRRRFVADASHELKTPLSSIKLLSDSILQNESIDGGTVREFVSDIGEEAERLARTTEKLMTLTRLDGKIDETPVSVDLRDVAASTLRMLRPLAAATDTKLVSALDAGCTVLATEDTLHQVVFNLVENALKYNVPGGSVTATLTREQNEAVFVVSDTGIGVPDDDLPHIFDRFYRVDKARSRAFGGSGLGLSIVRDTVSAYNGEITAERREEGGMIFTVRFPLYKPIEI